MARIFSIFLAKLGRSPAQEQTINKVHEHQQGNFDAQNI